MNGGAASQFFACILITVLILVFVVGGLGFEFCVFVAGWRHALRSEWPCIIIMLITVLTSSIYWSIQVLTKLLVDHIETRSRQQAGRVTGLQQKPRFSGFKKQS